MNSPTKPDAFDIVYEADLRRRSTGKGLLLPPYAADRAESDAAASTELAPNAPASTPEPQEPEDCTRIKKQSGQEPPVHLPNLFAPCDQCLRDTPTKILFMKAGLGNACAGCGRLRRGTPYISQNKFNSIKLLAKGGNYDLIDSTNISLNRS